MRCLAFLRGKGVKMAKKINLLGNFFLKLCVTRINSSHSHLNSRDKSSVKHRSDGTNIVRRK